MLTRGRKVALILFAGAASAILAFVVYESTKHVTTVADVEQWVSSLPPDASPADVERFFDATQMSWVVISPQDGSPKDYDPSDRPGVEGYVEHIDPGWMIEGTIMVWPRFDKSDHLKSTSVEEQYTGP